MARSGGYRHQAERTGYKPRDNGHEGFGNVGEFTLKNLAAMGAKIVAVTDSYGGDDDKETAWTRKSLLHHDMRKIAIEYPGGTKKENRQNFRLAV